MESDWDTWTKERLIPLLLDPMQDAKEPAKEPPKPTLKTFAYLPYRVRYSQLEARGLPLLTRLFCVAVLPPPPRLLQQRSKASICMPPSTLL